MRYKYGLIWIAIAIAVLGYAIYEIITAHTKPVLQLQCKTIAECLNKTDDITKYKEIVYNITNGTIIITYDEGHKLYRIYYSYKNKTGGIAVKPDDEFIRRLLLAFFK